MATRSSMVRAECLSRRCMTHHPREPGLDDHDHIMLLAARVPVCMGLGAAESRPSVGNAA
eukprot:780404-Rhodomonas_salina.1